MSSPGLGLLVSGPGRAAWPGPVPVTTAGRSHRGTEVHSGHQAPPPGPSPCLSVSPLPWGHCWCPTMGPADARGCLGSGSVQGSQPLPPPRHPPRSPAHVERQMLGPRGVPCPCGTEAAPALLLAPRPLPCAATDSAVVRTCSDFRTTWYASCQGHWLWAPTTACPPTTWSWPGHSWTPATR